MYNNDTSDIFLVYVGPHIFIIFLELKTAEFGKTCAPIHENLQTTFFEVFEMVCNESVIILAGYLYYLMTVLQFLS